MMYSRRFDQQGSVVPPDYSGVVYRREAPSATENTVWNAPAADRLQRPRRALYEMPAGEEQRMSSSAAPSADTQEVPPPPPKEGTSFLSGLGGLRKHSFTLEDIALAGLILLLLNSEEGEGDLLLILGFLLLVGLG